MAIVPLGDRLVFRAFYSVGYPDMVALISFCLIAPCIVGLHIIRNRSDLPGAGHRLTDAFEDGIGGMSVEIRHHNDRKVVRVEQLDPLLDQRHRAFT